VLVAPDPEEAQQAAMDATGLTRRQLWFAAVKPPMYTVCIIPVLVSLVASFYSCLQYECVWS
jgi:1,4-dihydroxy-2-naphthoate octaprenyltransferase